MKCRECGRANLVDSSFCEQCGSRLGPAALPRLEDSPTIPINRLQPGPNMGPGGLPLGAAHELPPPSAGRASSVLTWLVLSMMLSCSGVWFYLNRGDVVRAFSPPPAVASPSPSAALAVPARRTPPRAMVHHEPPAIPDRLALMRRRGIDLAQRHHWRQAIDPLYQVVNARPRDTAAVFYLFTCYRALEDQPQHGSTAYQLAGRVVRLNPHSQFARGARQYLAQADRQTTDDDGGTATAVASQPSQPGAMHNDPSRHTYQFYGPTPPEATADDTTPLTPSPGQRRIRRYRRGTMPSNDAPPFSPQTQPGAAPAVTNPTAPGASPNYPVMPNPFRNRPYNPSQQNTQPATPLFP